METRRLDMKLPITTRGIGILIQDFYTRFQYRIRAEKNLQIMHEICPYALFRISLAQLEVRLNIMFDNNIHDTVQLQRSTIRPIANIINACGQFEHNEKFYVPQLIDDDTYHPSCVRFTNLREYVLAMSDSNTNSAIRQLAYEYNALPFSIWNHDLDEGPTLKNFDDYITENYDINNIINDIKSYNNLHNKIEPRYPNLFLPLEYNDDGNSSILVSTEFLVREPIKNPEVNGEEYDLANTPAPIGTLRHFYSLDNISATDSTVGIISLMGENVLGFPSRAMECQSVIYYNSIWFENVRAMYQQ